MTFGLAVAGGVVGVVLGAGLLAVFGLLIDGWGGFPYMWDAFVVAGAVGTLLGGVLAPLAGWLFLRHVPFSCVFGSTAVGTALGASTGLLASSLDPVSAVGGAIAGFALSVVTVRLRTPRLHVEYKTRTG